MLTPRFLHFLLAFGFFAACLLQPGAVAANQTYDLRVYGKLYVEERQGGDVRTMRITAQDNAHARQLFSKFISDFTSLPTVKGREPKVGPLKLTVLSFEGGRAVLPVLTGTNPYVDLYLFENPAQLDAFLKSPPVNLGATSAPSVRAHPPYLDLWDQRNMGFWYALGFKAITKDRTDDQDFAFMRPLKLNVNSVGGSVAAIAARCDRDDLGYKINRWYDVANYAYDGHPEAANVADPDMTYFPIYYGDVPLADNPIKRAQAADSLAYFKQFTDDDHLMTITDAYGEVAASNDFGYPGYSYRDEYSRQDLVHYLRDLRKLSLPDLGARWYGDPSRFKEWTDVKFPRERDFYGWIDGKSQDLAGTWKLRYFDRQEGEKDQVYTPGYDDARWFSYRQPGSQYLVADFPAWVRHTFTPDPALLKAGTPIYLTVCPFNNSYYDNPSTVYLNGQKLADLSLGHAPEWGQMEVTKALHQGENVLTVFSPKSTLRGPVFLTLSKAEQSFPTRDPHLNARHFDVREWVADCGARAVALSVKRYRGIDPNRAVKLMAPHDNIDVIMPYMEEWGIYPHCTGEGDYFRPWLRRNGYLHGIMGSSETSQSPKNLLTLKRVFFAITFEGQGVLDYFYNLHDLLVHPDKQAWYEKNLPYYNLCGRFDIDHPQVAIAWSLRNNRYGVKDGSSYQNDPGRGDLQQAHYSDVYCSEKDIKEGRADAFKVMIDDNFTTLDSEDVDALEAWVRKGGTLVLNQRSGRNSILQPDVWPITRLTGCVHTVRPQEGTVAFEKHPSLLKAYAGKTFKNYGEVVDYQKVNYFSDSVSLEPKSDDIEVIARYADNKPAIIVRSLGKGKVVVLGSAFYRKSTDVKGFYVGSAEQTLFYKSLLGDLGVQPVVESNQDLLWSERFIANNGSTEMLVLGNQSDTTGIEGASAVWDLGFTPHRVFDPATGADVPAKIEGTRVIISNLSIAPWEMRYYAVERTDWDTTRTVEHWLERQGQLWRAVPRGEELAKPAPYWPVFWHGLFQARQFDSEAEARTALAPDYRPGTEWRFLPGADWASSGLNRGPNLWAVYRGSFEIDPGWLEDLRGVQFIQGGRALWSNLREVSVNGLVIQQNGKTVNQDKLLSVLKPGKNLLTLLSASGPDGNGGFYGDMGFRRLPGASGETMDLNKAWTVYPTEVDPQSVDLPNAGKWLLARRNVIIPAKYRHDQVWIEVDGLPVIATNGRVRYASNGNGSPKPTLVNITPDIHFGEENEIVLGSSWFGDRKKFADMTIKSVKLILVPQ